MSLWSKLGLADAASVVALQQELKELKLENERLQQENIQQWRAFFQSQATEIHQTLVQHQQEVFVQVEKSRQEHQAISAAMAAGQKGNSSLLEQLLSVSSMLSELKSQAEEQQKQLLLLQKRFAADGSELKETILRLAENQKRNTETLSNMDKTLQELPGMKEYLYHLWDAMKLVWINDLLNDIDK